MLHDRRPWFVYTYSYVCRRENRGLFFTLCVGEGTQEKFIWSGRVSFKPPSTTAELEALHVGAQRMLQCQTYGEIFLPAGFRRPFPNYNVNTVGTGLSEQFVKPSDVFFDFVQHVHQHC